MELVFCQGGNRAFGEAAVTRGWRYGAQLPATTYFPVWFADQDWKKPNRERYMTALAQHRPHLATVLDLESVEQLPEVLDWAEEAAQYVAGVIIIPKAHGVIDRLPHRVGGADVVLGYSIPTAYGGTEVWAGEFAGWPVHLLGGSPHAQMRTYLQMHGPSEIISADGSMASTVATRHCKVWEAPGRWQALHDEHGQPWGHGAPLEAMRRSFTNIRAAWVRLGAVPDYAGSR